MLSGCSPEAFRRTDGRTDGQTDASSAGRPSEIHKQQPKRTFPDRFRESPKKVPRKFRESSETVP
eukprot:10885160-Alexandrium_andersonii.AAC.1